MHVTLPLQLLCVREEEEEEEEEKGRATFCFAVGGS